MPIQTLLGVEEKLLGELSSIAQRIAPAKEDMVVQVIADPFDQTLQQIDRQLATNEVTRLIKLRAQINHALERLRGGLYGTCEDDDCGEEISPKRLAAQPWATLCLRCQEIKERLS